MHLRYACRCATTDGMSTSVLRMRLAPSLKPLVDTVSPHAHMLQMHGSILSVRSKCEISRDMHVRKDLDDSDCTGPILADWVNHPETS